MFRPMMILGILVVALGFASFVFVPGWRTSPVSLVMIITLIALGGYAFTRDAISFYHEMKQEAARRQNAVEQNALEPQALEPQTPEEQVAEPQACEHDQEQKKD